MNTEIRRLRKLARLWGGDLRKVSASAFQALTDKESFYMNPFALQEFGVLYDSKQVVYSGSVWWAYLIHEMGHAFASPKSPKDADETPFLGWEITLVSYIGASLAEWEESNKEYVVSYPSLRSNSGWTDLGNLDRDQRGKIYAEALSISVEHGLITFEQGRYVPLAIR